MAQASPDTHRLAQGEGASLALPPMLVRAEKIAATVILGVHGRRAAGPRVKPSGESRPYGALGLDPAHRLAQVRAG